VYLFPLSICGRTFAQENLTPAEFDFRRVLDDIVLLSFFVGNDFLPHVPELNVFQDAMPLIWKTYCDIRPSLGGYMTADGHVNLDILRKFLHELSQVD
jgi:5'-3' exoribonuclease 1